MQIWTRDGEKASPGFRSFFSPFPILKRRASGSCKNVGFASIPTFPKLQEQLWTVYQTNKPTHELHRDVNASATLVWHVGGGKVNAMVICPYFTQCTQA